MPIPQFINTLEFAEQSLEIHDKIRASELPGLQDVLFAGESENGSGEIEYGLAGRRAGRKLTLRLVIRGRLALVCQRCLGELGYPLDIDRTFELVANESALPDSEFEDDEVDYLVNEPETDVARLVEEEVLLALPMASRHEHDCSGSVQDAQGQKPNPFRVLEGLKTSPKS